MELYLLNTSQGLKPLYDSDYEEKKKLRIGTEYKAKITVARDITKHKKYFALINCAWEYQDERRQAFFKNNINVFRKTVEIAAGHCDLVYSLQRKEWVEQARSIAFDKMDDLAFNELYERVKDVLFSHFLTHISVDEFMENLKNF